MAHFLSTRGSPEVSCHLPAEDPGVGRGHCMKGRAQLQSRRREEMAPCSPPRAPGGRDQQPPTPHPSSGQQGAGGPEGVLGELLPWRAMPCTAQAGRASLPCWDFQVEEVGWWPRGVAVYLVMDRLHAGPRAGLRRDLASVSCLVLSPVRSRGLASHARCVWWGGEDRRPRSPETQLAAHLPGLAQLLAPALSPPVLQRTGHALPSEPRVRLSTALKQVVHLLDIPVQWLHLS